MPNAKNPNPTCHETQELKSSPHKQDGTQKFDPIKLIKKENKELQKSHLPQESVKMDEDESNTDSKIEDQKPISSKHLYQKPPKPLETQETLERRLKIEEEVTFVSFKLNNLISFRTSSYT